MLRAQYMDSDPYRMSQLPGEEQAGPGGAQHSVMALRAGCTPVGPRGSRVTEKSSQDGFLWGRRGFTDRLRKGFYVTHEISRGGFLRKVRWIHCPRPRALNSL